VIEAERLMQKHRRNGLLVDTKLFVLFLVGTTNEARITRFKRTGQYTIKDFRLLQALMVQFQNVVTTPHVLAEVSNLTDLEPPELSRLRLNFQEIIQRTRELYEESSAIVADPAFGKLGLTDAAIRRVAERPVLVLTDDLPLYHYLHKSGLDAINFNHIRQF
jgi:hypothetical protein